jgi:hypothetical protein
MCKTQSTWLFVRLHTKKKGHTIRAYLDKLPLKPGIYDITCLHFIY